MTRTENAPYGYSPNGKPRELHGKGNQVWDGLYGVDSNGYTQSGKHIQEINMEIKMNENKKLPPINLTAENAETVRQLTQEDLDEIQKHGTTEQRAGETPYEPIERPQSRASYTYFICFHLEAMERTRVVSGIYILDTKIDGRSFNGLSSQFAEKFGVLPANLTITNFFEVV